MNLLNMGIGALVDSVGKVASDLITTDKERMELDLRGRELDQAGDQAQIAVNKVEAAHTSVFVAGWRPAIGWVGVSALAYQFLLYPLLMWAWSVAQALDLLPAVAAPPQLGDTDALWVILTGILGIASMRTYEKRAGFASTRLAGQQSDNAL
jgi:hypothetical protein